MDVVYLSLMTFDWNRILVMIVVSKEIKRLMKDLKSSRKEHNLKDNWS